MVSFSSSGITQYGGFRKGTDDGLLLCVGETSGAGNRNLIITDSANRTKDHDHETLSTHPTIFDQSAPDPDTTNVEWGSRCFVGTGAGGGQWEFRTGVGNIAFIPVTATTVGDGGTTNYAQFAADGELTLAGTARVTKSIDIENANLGKGASAPTEVVVGNFAVWEFGVNDDAVFDIVIPHDIAAGTDMTLNVVWQINEIGGDEVQWQIDYESIPADSSQAIGGAGTQVKSGDVVVPGTLRYLTETPMTIASANIAANEHCGIKLKRIAIDDGVAPGNEPGVVDVHIEYTSDKLGEAT
jgi:hypothetical protein